MKSVFKILIFISFLSFSPASFASEWASRLLNGPIMSFVGGASSFLSGDEDWPMADASGDNEDVVQQAMTPVPNELWPYILWFTNRKSWSAMLCVSTTFRNLLESFQYHMTPDAASRQGYDEIFPCRVAQRSPILDPWIGQSLGFPNVITWKSLGWKDPNPKPCPYLAYVEQNRGGYDEKCLDGWIVHNGDAYGCYRRKFLVMPKDKLIESLKCRTILKSPFLKDPENWGPQDICRVQGVGRHLFAQIYDGSVYHVRLGEDGRIVARLALEQYCCSWKLPEILLGSAKKIAFLKIDELQNLLSLGRLVVRDGRFHREIVANLPDYELLKAHDDGSFISPLYQFGHLVFVALKKRGSEKEETALLRCNLDRKDEGSIEFLKGNVRELIRTEEGRLLLILVRSSGLILSRARGASLHIYSADPQGNLVFENLGSFSFTDRGYVSKQVYERTQVYGMCGFHLVLGARPRKGLTHDTTSIYFFNTHTGRLAFQEDLGFLVHNGFVHETGDIYLYENGNVPQDGESNVRIYQPPWFCKDSTK